MMRIKNLLPGMLIIADADLKLKPEQVVLVERITTQIRDCIENGYLALLYSEVKNPPAAAAAPPAQAETSSSHSYKTTDTLHLDGRIAKAGILVKINGKEVRVTNQAFNLLLKLVVQLKKDHEGWVYGSDLTGGNYHLSIMRLKKQIAPYLKNPEFIENNGHGAYRISTHPQNVSLDETKIKSLHHEPLIQKLLESAGKLPANP